jgi:hypothetical protein
LTLPTTDAQYNAVSDWQGRQNGGGLDTTQHPPRPWCDGLKIDSLYQFSKRHEGWTEASNSHWGVGDSLFAAFRFQDIIDQVVTQSNLRLMVKQFYEQIFYVRNGSAYVTPQYAFDVANYPAINRICTFKP